MTLKRVGAVNMLPVMAAIATQTGGTRVDRTLGRRRVTERIFIEQRADKRFAELTDEQIRAAIDRFLDDEGFEMQVHPSPLGRALTDPVNRAAELVNEIMHPVDAHGQPSAPLISSEDARNILDACDDQERRKPTIPEVLPLVRALYEQHEAGCCLHIVLDDGNVDDASVAYCLENAKHDECRTLAALLSRMSKTQRRELGRT